MGILLPYIVDIGIVCGSYGIMPYMTPDTVQFGVRIPPAHLSSPSIAKVRKRYYAGWAIILLVAILGNIFAGLFIHSQILATAVYAPVFIIALLGLNFLNYYAARRRLLGAKALEHWYEGVTQGLVADTAAHIKTRNPSLAWGIPAILVTLASIVVPAMRYNTLPNRIAVHFAVSGTPNGFAAKSFGSVFGPIIIELILLIAMFLVHVNANRFAVRLDPSNPDASRRRYGVLRREGIKAAWVMLAVLNAGTTISLLPIWGIFVHSITSVVDFGTVVIFIGIIVSIVWIGRAAQTTRHVGQASGDARLVARDDDRYWLAGTIYFNRNDSSVFVPKRFGVGWTLNLGHPLAIVVILLILCIPVVVSLVGRG
ncbi:DUF1648 domain-containing protein [Alicyclobacillus mengziensis]|nr:DUF5808 domain-containing protein [Alicyclobacillus mengziensis]